MYARVARWEGADPHALAAAAAEIDERSESGPPEGVPAKGLLMLVDRVNGRAMAVTLFETEEDMAKGHEVLNTMSPPGEEKMGQRSVEIYEASTLRILGEWPDAASTDDSVDDEAAHSHDAE